MNVILILGNHLFDPQHFKERGISAQNTLFFMREDHELASYYRFHQHKILFFFAAMRTYRDELKAAGYNVHYEELKSENLSYEQSLTKFLKEKLVQKAFCFEIEDKFFETRIKSLFSQAKISLQTYPSPMFLTSRLLFQEYLLSKRRPAMKSFYESQRKRLQILVKDNQPVGGSWSFDAENRLALPKKKSTPPLPQPRSTNIVKEVSSLVAKEFHAHPGNTDDFWLPVDREGARDWLATFLNERLHDFGPYEDAIPPHSAFLFHSVLTPFLNCGLLTPAEVIGQTLLFSQKNNVPLSSLEGFIRQIIGWREFIRGVYQNFSEQQEKTNFWGHHSKLKPIWYEGKTGIAPLDETLQRVLKRGYAHHIERLMVVGSLMLLLEVEPHEAHRWFMEMFIDSSDWVMGPNVYGMALFSDGGIFATKPYICGSHYLRKMGGYAKEDWCDGVDGLYWQFIRKHREFFLKNPRLSMMVRASEKITEERWKILDREAFVIRQKLVYTE
jgi:deoxyribodipyrimidine photolyase-related protein